MILGAMVRKHGESVFALQNRRALGSIFLDCYSLNTLVVVSTFSSADQAQPLATSNR
jgi:hypothetical protein